MAATTNNVSALSKITVRAKARVRGIVPVAMAAIAPPTGPNRCRPNQKTSPRVARVNSNEGSLAANSEEPNTFNDRLTVAKYRMGLSTYGNPLSRGTT